MADKIAEVSDSVFGIADELALGLSTMKLLAFDIRQGRRYLAVWHSQR